MNRITKQNLLACLWGSVALALSAAAWPQGQAPPSAEKKTVAPARALRFRFVPEKSNLSFELPTTFHVVHGKAGSWKGEVSVEPSEPGVAHARIEIQAASLASGSASRDADMRDKVLEVDKYPLIVFEAGHYRGDLSDLHPGGSLTIDLSGTLTIHGAALPVQTPVECDILPDHVIVAGAVPVHWKEFGLRDMSKFFNKVRDPMTIIFRLRAEPESADSR